MQLDHTFLAKLALRWRRVGAMLPDRAMPGGPVPIGGKRKQKSKLPTQPQMKRPRPDPDRQVQELADLIVGLVATQDSQVVVDILAFVLQPRFLPDYTQREVTVLDPDQQETATRWVKTAFRDRAVGAMEEIERLVRTYAVMLLVSKRVHEILLFPELRVAMYNQWFRTPTPPAWLNPNVEPPVPGVRIPEQQLRGIYANSIPELDPDKPSQSTWYAVYLANVVRAWSMGQYYRNQVKRVRAKMNPIRNIRPRDYAWPWVGDATRDHVRISLYTDQRIDNEYGTISVTVQASDIPHIAFSRSAPGKTAGPQNAPYPEGFVEPHMWLSSEVKAQITRTMIEIKRMENPQAWQARFGNFLARSALGMSIVRIPAFAVPETEKITTAPEHGRGIIKNGIIELYTFGARVLPTIVWEPPMTVLPTQVSEKLVYQPGLGRISLRGPLVLADAAHTAQVFSLMHAQHPSLNVRLAGVLQLKQQPRPEADVVGWGNPVDPTKWNKDFVHVRYNTTKLALFRVGQVNTYDQEAALPDYMQPYRIPGPWEEIDEDDNDDDDNDDDDETLGGFIVPNE